MTARNRDYTHGLRDWIASIPAVKEWFEKKSLGKRGKGSNTGEVYASFLWRYWRESLAPRGYKDIMQFVGEIRDQQNSQDVTVKRKWAKDVEKFYLGTKLSNAGRFVLVQAVKSFLKEHVDLARYEFSGVTKDSEQIAPLETEELRRLLNEASTRDKAVFLTQISAGFGIGEFLEFSKVWKLYEKAIRENQVPIRVDIVRPKTGVKFFSFLWDDCVHALADLLAERERVEGKTPEHLFVKKYGGAVEDHDIQNAMRDLANRTGLELTRQSKRIYRFRPHELRDYFKSKCNEAGVPGNTSEFCLGHTVDDLGYSKEAWLKKGEEKLKLELSKVRASLNVLTGYDVRPTLTKLPYLTEAVEWISLFKGLPNEQVEKGILAMLKRSPAFAKALETYKPAKMEFADTEDQARNVALGMERTAVFPSVLSYVQSLETQATTPKKLIQKVIPEGELQKYIDEGWSFRSVINTHSVLVEREGA